MMSTQVDAGSEGRVARAKELYRMICAGKMTDGHDVCSVVSELEKIVGKEFNNTQQFHYYVAEYLKRKDRVGETMGRRLLRTRRRAKLTQIELAKILGVDRRTIVRWETTDLTPSAEAVAWMNGPEKPSGGNETFVENRQNIADPPIFDKNPPEK
jgi:DNA-binding XRE family transcriptional regulator